MSESPALTQQKYRAPELAWSKRLLNNESSDTMSASPPGPTPGKMTGLDDSVMRTVVSRGNEALDILFEAAAHQERASAGNAPSAPPMSLSRPQSSSVAAARNHA